MSDKYLAVNDFLSYDVQISRKIGRVGEDVAAVKEQVNRLSAAFATYVSETDTYRLEINKRLDSIDSNLNGLDTRLDGLEQTVNSRLDTIEQTVSKGFKLLFDRLGIQS